MNRALFSILFAMVAFLSVPATAAAANGTIQGHFKFEQYTGGYCDPLQGQNCSGARYTASEYGTAQPLQNAYIRVENHLGGIIGSCHTNTNGYYDCDWSASTLPPWVRVVFRFEDKDRRFRVVGSDGNSYYRYRSSKQYVQANDETKLIGTITIPRMGIAQIYDSAQRMYYGQLSKSSRMVAEFFGVRLHAYNNDKCPGTACAGGKNVYLSGSDFAYQGFVVLHELGHVVDNIAHSRTKTFRNSCWPLPIASCESSHGLESLEWRGHALIEGFASFIGTAAAYEEWAPVPRSCFFTDTFCINQNKYLVEWKIACSGKLGRTEKQHTRYLWDIIDSVNDGESVNANFYNIIDAIRDIPNGYAWGQAESPYNQQGNIDAWDSFHAWEFNQNFESSEGIDSSPAYFLNCLGYF